MSKVDIELLKKLRWLTSAPLKDCKEALLSAWDDLAKAQEYLRKAWAIKSAKKAGRETNEWVIKIKTSWNKLLAVKLACETDFVAKNEKFLEFADAFLDIIWDLESEEINSYEELSENDKEKFSNIIADTVAVVGENVKMIDVLKRDSEQMFVYEHPWNKIAWIVFYKSENEDSQNIAKELALQYVAMDPEYIRVEDIPSEKREALFAEFKEEVIKSWKPENIAESIVQWKLNKHFASMVLLEQAWIKDDTKKVKSIIPNDFELLEIIRYSI